MNIVLLFREIKDTFNKILIALSVSKIRGSVIMTSFLLFSSAIYILNSNKRNREPTPVGNRIMKFSRCSKK